MRTGHTSRNVAARPERIVLVGLPGSGKSTVGPILARALDWSFVDLDARIENETGSLVREIFDHYGEAGFRRLEGELTARLASEPGLVLAPGGGWIVHQSLPGAFVVWLQVDAVTAIERMGEDAAQRPLLQPEPMKRMKQLLEEREHHYRRADYAVDTTGLSPDDVARVIAGAIKEEHGHEKE